MCTWGQGGSTLVVLSRGVSCTSGQPFATVEDVKPGSNITPFSRCGSPPVVARSKLSGSPPVCVPKPMGTWVQREQGVQLVKLTVLSTDAVLLCSEGGQIRIADPAPCAVAFPSGNTPKAERSEA